MFNILPLILILISICIIIIIILRRFSEIANIDVNSIQSEREIMIKERIISNKLKRNYLKQYNKVLRSLKPIFVTLGDFFKSSYKKLLEFKENYNKNKITEDNAQVKIEKLFQDIDKYIKEDNFESAEKGYIEIIGIDGKNIKAFKDLADLYFEKKDYKEAKQTYEHVLRLLEKDLNIQAFFNGEVERESISSPLSQLSDVYFELSLINKTEDNTEEALIFINKSLQIEPNNPRYLDTKIEICIIRKEKERAMRTYYKLEKVNPENQKLEDIKKQIENL